MHLVKNPNCVKTAPKEVVESYSTQHGHVKIMSDCLGSVKRCQVICATSFNYLFLREHPREKRLTSIWLILAHV